MSEWKGVAVAEYQHVAILRRAAYDVGQRIQLGRMVDDPLDRRTVVELSRMVILRSVAERKDSEGITDVFAQTRDLGVNPEIKSPVDRKNVDHRLVY